MPTNQGEDYTVIAMVDRLREFVGDNFSFPKGSQTVQGARVQAAYCYKRKAVSFTVRDDNHFVEFCFGAKPSPTSFQLESDFKPGSSPQADRLNTVQEICVLVAAQLRLKEHSNGFVIVSGGTNSMKSKLARGLIHLHIEELMKDWLVNTVMPANSSGGKATVKRRPHLVTCEDDIEKEFYDLDPKRSTFVENCYAPAQSAFTHDLWRTELERPDYTPRLLGTDVESMAQAVEDALRMTPAVFYAGEIRRKGDWTALYRLAQSHLVVLTAHASGLANTFAILQNHLNLKTASQRSEMASAIAGVVHMRGLELPGKEVEKRISGVVPVSWVNTETSVAAFTADGLASIVPNYADLCAKGPNNKVQPCLGRLSFAKELLARSKQRAASSINVDEAKFLQEMAAWDMRGE